MTSCNHCEAQHIQMLEHIGCNEPDSPEIKYEGCSCGGRRNVDISRRNSSGDDITSLIVTGALL